MSTTNAQGVATFLAAEDIPLGRRVKIESNSTVSIAGVDDTGIGVTKHAASAGTYITVELWNANGTRLVGAGGDIAVGDKIGAAADGKVVKDGEIPLGYALSAGEDGSLVEVTIVPLIESYLAAAVPAGTASPEGVVTAYREFSTYRQFDETGSLIAEWVYLGTVPGNTGWVSF